MRVLFLAHAFNSLAQRLHVELRARGHEVSVELDINDAVAEEAVELFRPDVVLAPFLKRAIPPSLFRRIPCLVVHPGVILESHNRFFEVKSRRSQVAFSFDPRAGRIVERPLTG